MAGQQFCLKWNNHTNNMLTVFESLRSAETLVDVTLACGGRHVKAHKLVLSACSPFFQDLFSENPCKHPIVFMNDVDYKNLKAIVDFMYQGAVNVSQDQLSSLLRTAEALKIKGLAEVNNSNQDSQASQEITPSREKAIVPRQMSQQQPSTPRADSPPMQSRRRPGRSRKRSRESNHSDLDEPVPIKIQQPASPEIEEIVDDTPVVRSDSQPRRGPNTSRVSKHSSVQQSFSSQQFSLPSDVQFAQPVAEEVEPSKLLVQTLTTDNVPSTAASSSVSFADFNVSSGANESSQLDVSNNQALVPASMSDSLSSSHLEGPESPLDVKPVISFENTLPSTSQSFMDQSSMPGTSFEDNSALIPQDAQSQVFSWLEHIDTWKNSCNVNYKSSCNFLMLK